MSITIRLEPKRNTSEEIYPADVRVERDFFSFYELKRMLDRKDIVLKPVFQRNTGWKKRQKSTLIESMLMNIPLPLFYFAVDQYGTYSVVDGLQRLKAVFSFMDDKYSLSSLAYLSKYAGCYFSDLPRSQQAKIEKYHVQGCVINYPTPKKVQLDIFARVNSGGTILSKQELSALTGLMTKLTG